MGVSIFFASGGMYLLVPLVYIFLSWVNRWWCQRWSKPILHQLRCNFPFSLPLVSIIQNIPIISLNSHPYHSVTSVGGTTGTTEVVASFTGGGFSKNFAAPSYQSSVVATYLAAQGSTYSGKFNAKGRGFPDVSAQASNYIIYSGGRAQTVSGTSCATPM